MRLRLWIIAPLLSSAAAAVAFRRGALDPSGSVGAVGIGTAVFGAGGFPASTLLLLFFASSTALSRSRARASSQTGAVKGPRRNLAQVLANGAVPAALAMIRRLRPSPRLAAAYAGAIAAANADTWATEVGALSCSAPRLITTFRKVRPGMSGAVTPLGMLSSLGGAMFIGFGHSMFERRIGAILPVGTAGFAGALADSVLGATAQAVYRCRVCGDRTEDRRHHHAGSAPALTLMRGLPFMTNDAVNLCASLVGAAFGAWLVSGGE